MLNLSRFLTVHLNNQLRFKSYKKYLDYSRVPKLDEKDLEEQFIKGSGPGGQAVNKANNCILLKHIPTGLVVKCQETREQSRNRVLARELLIRKLDNKLNGELSIDNQLKILQAKDAVNEKRKREKMRKLKEDFKKREGID